MKKEIRKQIEKKKKNKPNFKWILTVTIATFIISILFSTISELIVKNVNIYFSIFILIIFIFIGVIFDIIGVAVTSSEEKPFHSMSARKVKGSKEAYKLIKNAEKVSSFCNDVIGDICGIMSGSVGVTIALSLSNYIPILVSSLLTTAIIASLTIGFKALGKTYAINKSNEIVYRVSKIITIFN